MSNSVEIVGSIAKDLGVEKISYDRHSRTVTLQGRISYSDGCLLNLRLHSVKDVFIDRSRLKYFDSNVGGVGSSSSSSGRAPEMSEEELKERFDSPELLKEKCNYLLELIRTSKHFVVYTGAGISTACKIPDFRGPNGAWTRRDRGLAPPKCIGLAQAIPSKAHMALVALQNAGIMKYISSQNIDGLHRRSGISPDLLSELHGNAFLEKCPGCKKEFLRSYDTTDSRSREHDPLSQSGISHITGRTCTDCGVKLRDSIIHFTESLPELDLRRGLENANKSDLALTLGTSLRVTPASDLPARAISKNDGEMVIVNLQRTPKDKHVLRSGGMLIHGKIDIVMQIVMDNLGLEIPKAKILTLEELLSDYSEQKSPVDSPDKTIPVVENIEDIEPEKMEDIEPASLPGKKELELLIGNRHEQVSGGGHNHHRWTMFVRCNTSGTNLQDLVEEVSYHLHPTFDPSVIRSRNEPYEVSCLGWGTFEVGVVVKWKPILNTPDLRCKHHLNFKNPETSRRFKVALQDFAV